MDIKTALRQLRSEKKEINELKLLRDSKVSMLTSGAIRYDRPKVQTSPEDMMLKLGAEIADLDAEIEKHIRNILKREADCMAAINRIEKSDYRRILQMRYIGEKSMTWAQIGNVMGFSEDWVKHKHGDALNEARKYWKNSSQNNYI